MKRRSLLLIGVLCASVDCSRTELDHENLSGMPALTEATGGFTSTGNDVYVLGGTLSTSGGSVPVSNAGTAAVAPDALLKATSISSGESFTCAVITDGSLRCWGENGYGQLGNGSGVLSSVPVTVINASEIAEVAGGDTHACARSVSGTVLCWGANEYGQLGNGSTNNSATPVTVEGLSGAIAITAGYAFSCALLADGTVACWGSNRYGELGIGGTNSVAQSTFAVWVEGITNAIQISAGSHHACAVLRDGSIQCWGFNVNGEVGNVTSGGVAAALQPVTVVDVADALLVAAGGSHTCAILSGQRVKCWGAGQHGQLGSRGHSEGYQAVEVAGIAQPPIAISAGDSHTCTVNADGTAYCWGYNSYGQLGNGTTATSPMPVVVANLSGVQSLSAGYAHNCAVLNEGSVWCWGGNYSGALGNGSLTQSLLPVKVVGF